MLFVETGFSLVLADWCLGEPFSVMEEVKLAELLVSVREQLGFRALMHRVVMRGVVVNSLNRNSCTVCLPHLRYI